MSKNLTERARLLKDIFEKDSRRFEVIGEIATGAEGSAWKVNQLDENDNLQRRFVVKFATNDAYIDSLRRERRITNALYGAMHSAQPVVSSGAMLQPQLPHDTPAWGRNLLITEYIPHITLDEFIGRTVYSGITIPNRVLWMITLCRIVVRMLLGMSNPPGRALGETTEPPKLESRREPGTYQVYHGDLTNYKNLIFGELDNDEHRLVPILKAIDFGQAIDDPNQLPREISADTLTSANIYEVGQVMRILYRHVNIQAHLVPTFYSNLDMDFYNIAGRCAAEDFRSRPKITELFDIVYNAVRTKTGPEHFAGKKDAHQESDENIRQFVRNTILS